MTSEHLYREGFIDALGSWIRGWRELPDARDRLFATLEAEAASLPSRARRLPTDCYRKRFLYSGDLLALFSPTGLVETSGTSWTTDRDFAELFHGAWRDEAVSGAVFRRRPKRSEVVVNVAALYADARFVAALDRYMANEGLEADAFRRIGNRQGEVILKAPLRATEIVGLTGWASDFEKLCAACGITDDAGVDRALAALRTKGIDPYSATWIKDEAAQAAVRRVMSRIAP